ncbi:prepilin-type N-terminal cleavage/methylation domain-containing protein [Pseudidiomarina indica]|uniref:Type II secretion system protein H n=1 Tax=Pseudidiomarina indica TaxID=1159017 RepID=A0A1G6BIJ3_9GAMM|nr:GspH/FimT family pseudopilin [Pseudidiomarina indica]SDB20435.1 prepilin-type N-terminal cleavage/methylation domain-containing protein [Pseudidiomarina indica]
MPTGFSLLELMVVLVILIVALGWGLPSVQALTTTLRLQAAAHDTYALLQQARWQAMQDHVPRFVVWQGSGEHWCVAISLQAECDCRQQECAITDGDFRLHSHAYPGVMLQGNTFAQGSMTRFDGQRGLTHAYAGGVSYAASLGAQDSRGLRVIVSTLGRVRICQQGVVGSYAAC